MKEFGQSVFRILIVDDTADIHQDIRKVLAWHKAPAPASLKSLESELFEDGEAPKEESEISLPQLRFDSAFQGAQAIQMFEKALQEKDPYHLIFMDVRMPPGMDGVEAAQQIWKIEPDVGIIMCTAYSDYSIEAIQSKLGVSEKLLFLIKPFSPAVLKQGTIALLKGWFLDHQQESYIKKLQNELNHQPKGKKE